MEPIARGIWSERQILDALLGRAGKREVSFRGDIMRGGAKLREVTLGSGSSVSMDADADVQRTARFVLFEELDWLLDEIKPYMLLRMEDATQVTSVLFETWAQRDALQWSWAAWDAKGYTWAQMDAGRADTVTVTPQYAEFALGVFVPSTPRRATAGGLTSWDVQAYDRTVILQEDSLTEPLYFAAGTEYLDAVQSVLAGAGIANVMIADTSDAILPADREFEIGTKKLEIANALLREIVYDPVWFDVDGVCMITRYAEPSPARIDFTYAAGDLSVIARDTQSELDLYGVPNVFIGICSNPDMDQDYVSVYVNDNPVSRLSTGRRGRRIVSEIYQFDAIATQEDLDAAVAKIAFEANQVEEIVTVQTALMPIHGRLDTLALSHPDVEGTVTEHVWELPLEAGAWMTHTCKRLVIA